MLGKWGHYKINSTYQYSNWLHFAKVCNYKVIFRFVPVWSEWWDRWEAEVCTARLRAVSASSSRWLGIDGASSTNLIVPVVHWSGNLTTLSSQFQTCRCAMTFFCNALTSTDRHELRVGGPADGAECNIEPHWASLFAHFLLQELLDPAIPGSLHRSGRVGAQRGADAGALRGGERAQV